MKCFRQYRLCIMLLLCSCTGGLLSYTAYGNTFSIKDSSSNEVFYVDDVGNLSLDGFLVTGCSSISSRETVEEWVLRYGEDIIALVDLSGDMKGRMQITGNLYEDNTPSGSDPFNVKNTSGTTVLSIDSSGNLYLDENIGFPTSTTPKTMVNLVVYGSDGTTPLAYDKESSPGAYLFYNQDDDDGDGTVDKDDTSVAGENDLLKVKFEFSTFFDGLETGEVTISRDNSKIKLWEEETKVSEITFTSDEKTFDLSISAERTAFSSDIKNQNLWLEGCTSSGSLKDTGLTLSYDDGEVVSDSVELTVLNIQVTDVAFNRDRTGHTSDAVNIRENYGWSLTPVPPSPTPTATPANREIVAPEWEVDSGDAGTDPDKCEPALFLKQTSVKVWARLTVSPSIVTAKIRADGYRTQTGDLSIGNLGASSGQSESWKSVSFSSGVSVGVKVPPTTGEDGYVEFTPQNQTANSVLYEDSSFQFQINEINGDPSFPWININAPGQKEAIRLYTILDDPTHPWDTTDTGGNDHKQPWVDALEWGTEWAKDKTTVNSAATEIAKGIYDNAPFQYNGRVTDFLLGDDYFLLTLFIEKLETHDETQEGDCEGAANSVCTYTNLLGGDFDCLLIYPEVGHLNVNDPIGETTLLNNQIFYMLSSTRNDPFSYQDGSLHVNPCWCIRMKLGVHMVAGYIEGENATIWDIVMKIISGSDNPDTCAENEPATSTGLTQYVLTDSNANWVEDQFIGYYLYPNMANITYNPYKVYEITDNDETTITTEQTDGEMTDYASSGDYYAIFSFKQGEEEASGVTTEYLTELSWTDYKLKCVDSSHCSIKLEVTPTVSTLRDIR